MRRPLTSRLLAVVAALDGLGEDFLRVSQLSMGYDKVIDRFPL